MKLEVINNNNGKRFKDLSAGDVFCYVNKFYMKLKESKSLREKANAVNLDDGAAVVFSDDAAVKAVNAKICIDM